MRTAAGAIACALLTMGLGAAQDEPGILAKIDAMTQSRYAHVVGFSDTEHYVVYRGADLTDPAAEMTVRVTYRKGAGKSYKVLSQSGSGVIQHFALRPLLDNEKEINDPARVSQSWFTTENYEMHVSPAEQRMVEGRTCIAVAIHPRRKAANMIDGTLWVYPADGAILEVDGIASKEPSVFAGTTKMMRQYAMMDGYAQATRARAESNGMFGTTVVKIEYSDYRIEMK